METLNAVQKHIWATPTPPLDTNIVDAFLQIKEKYKGDPASANLTNTNLNEQYPGTNSFQG